MPQNESIPSEYRQVIFPVLSVSWHGGTRVLIQVANYLAGLGYEVVILLARNRCNTPYEIAAGVTIRHAGIHTGLKAIDYFVFLCCVPFQVRGRALLIANFFVTYYPVRLLALLKRLPYLYFVQDIESKYPLPWGAMLNLLCNWTYRDKHIVAANAHLRKRLRDEFGTDSRNISVGPAKIFYELPPQSEKDYDVVYFLRGEPWKGLDRFKRFLATSKGRLSCVCVSQDETMRAGVDDSGAVFFKPKSDDELVKHIDSARLLLLTSYREGFALPPLECMARGVPAVLYRCGGPDLYVRDGCNAIYVEDETQAVQVVEALVSDSVRYANMQREARFTADQYRMDKSLAMMAEFVAECPKW